MASLSPSCQRSSVPTDGIPRTVRTPCLPRPVEAAFRRDGSCRILRFEGRDPLLYGLNPVAAIAPERDRRDLALARLLVHPRGRDAEQLGDLLRRYERPA